MAEHTLEIVELNNNENDYPIAYLTEMCSKCGIICESSGTLDNDGEYNEDWQITHYHLGDGSEINISCDELIIKGIIE